MPAGYSGTPLARKLGLQPEMVIATIDAPAALAALLAPLPDGITFTTSLSEPVDIVVLFASRRNVLDRFMAVAAKAIFPAGAIWVAWPKRASKVPTDVTEDTIREIALPMGLVDVKVCAIDDVWSGLRVVWRLDRRSGGQ